VPAAHLYLLYPGLSVQDRLVQAVQAETLIFRRKPMELCAACPRILGMVTWCQIFQVK